MANLIQRCGVRSDNIILFWSVLKLLQGGLDDALYTNCKKPRSFKCKKRHSCKLVHKRERLDNNSSVELCRFSGKLEALSSNTSKQVITVAS